MTSEIKKEVDKRGNNVYSIKQYYDPDDLNTHTIWPIIPSDLINILIKKGLITEADLDDIKR